MTNNKTTETIAVNTQAVADKILDSSHFTLGEISVLITFVATIVSFLWVAAKVGASASDLKNEFVLMDVKITNELATLAARTEALNSKTDTGFGYVKSEMAKQNVRININSHRIKDVEYYLIKGGFVPRQYNVDDSV
jgi:hypothetical protein